MTFLYIVEVLMNKMTSSISIHANDWTAEREIIANNDLFVISRYQLVYRVDVSLTTFCEQKTFSFRDCDDNTEVVISLFYCSRETGGFSCKIKYQAVYHIHMGDSEGEKLTKKLTNTHQNTHLSSWVT